ncbi:hypothetical protein LT493_21595 [Streptomyces tricolor]|nr:hypothetical protein [Streptomyces tricolor]
MYDTWIASPGVRPLAVASTFAVATVVPASSPDPCCPAPSRARTITSAASSSAAVPAKCGSSAVSPPPVPSAGPRRAAPGPGPVAARPGRVALEAEEGDAGDGRGGSVQATAATRKPRRGARRAGAGDVTWSDPTSEDSSSAARADRARTPCAGPGWRS